MDNGPELTSRALDQWAYERGIRLRFIAPGKPVQNAFIESFTAGCGTSASTRTGSATWPRARQIVEAWRLDYNHVRPHSALDGLSPETYRLVITGSGVGVQGPSRLSQSVA